MGTETLAQLRDRLSQVMGDYLHETVTTNLAANKSVICTDLAKYTTRDGYFPRKWCLITSLLNAGENRKILDYANFTTTLTVLGADWAPDSTAATFEIHTYNPDNKVRAINGAARELYPLLFRRVEWNDTLIMGNHLPNAHFEDWTVSTAPDKYSLSAGTITAAAYTTADNTSGGYRGGTTSMKLTTGVAGGGQYALTSSSLYPALLNLQGQTVTFKCWAYPEVANDATIEIYTLKADSTAQTLTSTTTCASKKWTQLSLESQALNDDLILIEFRFKVTSNSKYVCFDDARVIGNGIFDLMLPSEFWLGHISSVFEQISGNSDDICDDPATSVSDVTPLYGCTEYTNAGIKYLRLPYASSAERRLILQGYTPLEDTLSDDTDTMTIDDPHIELLISQAAYRLCEMEAGLVSSEDRKRLIDEAQRWLGKVEYLKGRLRMARPQPQTKFARI